MKMDFIEAPIHESTVSGADISPNDALLKSAGISISECGQGDISCNNTHLNYGKNAGTTDCRIEVEEVGMGNEEVKILDVSQAPLIAAKPIPLAESLDITFNNGPEKTIDENNLYEDELLKDVEDDISVLNIDVSRHNPPIKTLQNEDSRATEDNCETQKTLAVELDSPAQVASSEDYLSCEKEDEFEDYVTKVTESASSRESPISVQDNVADNVDSFCENSNFPDEITDINKPLGTPSVDLKRQEAECDTPSSLPNGKVQHETDDGYDNCGIFAGEVSLTAENKSFNQSNHKESKTGDMNCVGNDFHARDVVTEVHEPLNESRPDESMNINKDNLSHNILPEDTSSLTGEHDSCSQPIQVESASVDNNCGGASEEHKLLNQSLHEVSSSSNEESTGDCILAGAKSSLADENVPVNVSNSEVSKNLNEDCVEKVSDKCDSEKSKSKDEGVHGADLDLDIIDKEFDSCTEGIGSGSKNKGVIRAIIEHNEQNGSDFRNEDINEGEDEKEIENTLFEHVDDDESLMDDLMVTDDVNAEDPFAQTSDRTEHNELNDLCSQDMEVDGVLKELVVKEVLETKDKDEDLVDWESKDKHSDKKEAEEANQDIEMKSPGTSDAIIAKHVEESEMMDTEEISADCATEDELNISKSETKTCDGASIEKTPWDEVEGRELPNIESKLTESGKEKYLPKVFSESLDGKFEVKLADVIWASKFTVEEKSPIQSASLSLSAEDCNVQKEVPKMKTADEGKESAGSIKPEVSNFGAESANTSSEGKTCDDAVSVIKELQTENDGTVVKSSEYSECGVKSATDINSIEKANKDKEVGSPIKPFLIEDGQTQNKSCEEIGFVGTADNYNSAELAIKDKEIYCSFFSEKCVTEKNLTEGNAFEESANDSKTVVGTEGKTSTGSVIKELSDTLNENATGHCDDVIARRKLTFNIEGGIISFEGKESTKADSGTQDNINDAKNKSSNESEVIHSIEHNDKQQYEESELIKPDDCSSDKQRVEKANDTEMMQPVECRRDKESVEKLNEIETIHSFKCSGDNESIEKLNDSEVIEPNQCSDKQSEGKVAVEKPVAQSSDKGNNKAKNNSLLDVTDEVEGETITGDKSHVDLTLDDEEEVCIIPDTVQVTPADGKASLKPRGKPVKGKEALPLECLELMEPDVGLPATPKTLEQVPTKTVGKSATAVRRPASESNRNMETTPSRPQRQAAKKAESQIKMLVSIDVEQEKEFAMPGGLEEISPSLKPCAQCNRFRQCKYVRPPTGFQGINKYICSMECVHLFTSLPEVISPPTPQPTPPAFPEVLAPALAPTEVPQIDSDLSSSYTLYVRKCGQCKEVVRLDEKTLSWETMDFCNEDCLDKYQNELGAHCANCKGAVGAVSLGKYCVRFGCEIKQFCCSMCLEEFKKGLKVCSYCQKDISYAIDGFLAPVGDKGQFKDFCTQACMEKYEIMTSNQPVAPQSGCCDVCNNCKPVAVTVITEAKEHVLCSEVCFAAFKFVNTLVVDRCNMCQKYYDCQSPSENFILFFDYMPHSFCSKTCMNVYIIAKRKIVPCSWCKVKKYNFDMIKRIMSPSGSGSIPLMMCSLNCLALYQVSINAVSARRIKCDMCKSYAMAQYHLTMSDATIRNFCTYPCVMSFQSQYNKLPITLPASDPIPTGEPKRAVPRRSLPISEAQQKNGAAAMPCISNITSLAGPPNGQPTPPPTPTPAIMNKPESGAALVSSIPRSPGQYKQLVMVKPPPPKQMRNKMVQVRPYMHTKGVFCRPHPCAKETQTAKSMGMPVLIPVPVPIYVPVPMAMYSLPFPVPLPFPIPIPVPIFIPTTRNSAQGIMKEIKRIQEKIPTDPFEAELLMMAEMVAGEKKDAPVETSDESDVEPDAADPAETSDPGEGAEDGYSSETMESSNTFIGEDVLQMALTMASEFVEGPPQDLEAGLTPSTITPQAQPASAAEPNEVESDPDEPEPIAGGQLALLAQSRASAARKRTMRSTRRVVKRARHSHSGDKEGGAAKKAKPVSVVQSPPPAPEQEKPDADCCLKFTYGVNAWRQWAVSRNAELEKTNAAATAATTDGSRKALPLLKCDLLQLTADELSYSLCLFVKEVHKPNGSQYAPDTVYYFCLGIQQYLFINGRIDNIFTDGYYEKFTEALDEVAKKFAQLYDDTQYIVTRVEEEHLWESKQLGAHSPHVLLSTLLFFNTKHFNLTTVDEHMQLSFSHIMKHWKRNPNQPGATASNTAKTSKNVLLRFYPPSFSADSPNTRKKKVYEQQENEVDPLRCPVKLYEFYLSKCPESVRSRNDVFYLQPERSCVPDSPVWYSTMALSVEPLEKMLHRVKMVKEINIALLTT